MADVFQRRCGCGSILRARQSCERCASEARARLHASGLCDAERPRQPYDCGKHQGNAALYKKPPLGKKPEWLDLKLPKDAMRVDWQTREEWQRRFAVTPAPGVDVVHDEESYRANLEARRKEEARYSAVVTSVDQSTKVVAGQAYAHYWCGDIRQMRVEWNEPGCRHTSYTRDTEADRAEKRWVRLA